MLKYNFHMIKCSKNTMQIIIANTQFRIFALSLKAASHDNGLKVYPKDI